MQGAVPSRAGPNDQEPLGHPQQLTRPLAGGGQLVGSTPITLPKAVQQIDHLFRRHIAGGAGAPGQPPSPATEQSMVRILRSSAGSRLASP